MKNIIQFRPRVIVENENTCDCNVDCRTYEPSSICDDGNYEKCSIRLKRELEACGR